MTAEPPIPFPASPYCRVRARVASIWADGPDDGTHPDWRPAAGERVTLTPSIGSQLLTYDVTGPEPIIVTVERVECVVDEDGWLTKSDGRPVYIAPTDDPLLSATGWTWTASIKGKTVAFSAPSGGVVDLALFVATPAVDAVEYVSVVQVVADYIAANPPDVEQAVADYLTANPPTAAPDATAATKGVLQLAGDLGGTATAPTVPGLAGKADTGHGHAIGDVTGLQSALDGKQPSGSYAAATHQHTLADVTDYTAPDLSGYATTASLSTVATSGAYADLTGTPTIPDSPDDIGAAPAIQPINAQTAAYTLVASDAGKLVTVTAATAVDVTVPSGVFTAGQRVDVLDLGAERVTFVAGAGMTLGGTPSLVSRAQHSAHSVVFLSASQAVVVGDLGAA